MNVALQMLGYTVFNLTSNFLHLRKQWEKIFLTGGTTKDFYEMFKDVDAVVDLPCAYFWDEIYKAFPDAKVMNELTVVRHCQLKGHVSLSAISGYWQLTNSSFTQTGLEKVTIQKNIIQMFSFKSNFCDLKFESGLFDFF